MNTNVTKLVLLWLAVAGVIPTASAAQKGTREVRLSAICRGRGTIETTNYNGKFLVVGRPYTMVAKPSAGWAFTNWTDGYDVVVTNQPRLTFIMKPQSAFIANFVKRTGLPGVLDGVSLADVPTGVLAAVNAAPNGKQAQVLTEWIETIAAVHPSALPSVLTTVVTAHPELLTPAITSAVTASPATVYSLVHAAAAIPGVDLTNIVVAACTALPGQTYQIVQALLDVAPTLGLTVLQAVANSVPELAAVINTALANEPVALSRTGALEILSGAMDSINWPIIRGHPGENPHDYSRP